MDIRNLPEEVQSYILQWCMKEEKCPLIGICNELVTKNCAIVRFLSDLNQEADFLTMKRLNVMENRSH